MSRVFLAAFAARLLVGLLALGFASCVAAQSMYRWKDDSGRTVYGTHPPPNVKAQALQNRVQSYGGTAEVRPAPVAQAPAGKAPAAGNAQVVMYATSWCGYCAQARAYFARKGIAYTEHDVEKSPAAHAEFRRLGGRGVPLIVYGEQTMTGFSERGFEALRAGARR